MTAQYEPEELKNRIESRVRELEDAQIPDPAVSVEAVRGAVVEESARGALKVRPNSHRVVSLSSFSSSARVVYNGVPSGEVRLETGSARLLRVNREWRPKAFAGPMRQRRRVFTSGGTVGFTFHLPENRTTSILPPEPAPSGERAQVYPLPKPATAVKGTGILRYRSGMELQVNGGVQTLLRPGADGTLQARRGSVDADMLTSFDADRPQAKIGPTWITLTPNPSA